jgi:FkbM family methyltransferase
MREDLRNALKKYPKKIVTVIADAVCRSPIRKQLKLWNANNGNRALRLDYDLNQSSIVFDVGGYEGQWASDIYSMYHCRIYVFEPVGEFASQIQKRFSQNPNISVLQFGLGGFSRKEMISLCKAGSSIFRNSDNKQEIQIVEVKSWIEEQNIAEIDLMKVNIEGGEYELLERLIETGMVRIIRNIQVQFHNVEKKSVGRMEEIQKHLRKTHYPTYQYELIWENWARMSRNEKI